ncbi:MAG: hypothetical protein V3V81_07340 [Candidatus Bathyarchaeia archaeon]
MTILTWDRQSGGAGTALAAVHAVYGCPIEKENGYIMTIWDKVTKSDAEDIEGFEKPIAKHGKTIEELEAALTAGYNELAERPADWISEEV